MNKKKLIITALCVVLLAIIAVVVFLPRGVEIADKQIEDRLLYNKLCDGAYKICLESTPDLYKKAEYPVERDAVAEQLEFDFTVCNLLSEKKILMSRTETDNIAKSEYEAMLTDPQQEAFKNALFKVMKQENVTEQKYLELLCEEAYYRYNNFTLQTDFEHTGYDQNADEDFETQFREYVEDNM